MGKKQNEKKSSLFPTNLSYESYQKKSSYEVDLFHNMQ